MARHSDLLKDPVIRFHRVYVDFCGSITAALMLSQAVYWTPRTSDEDGWFFKTQDEWKQETGLSRREQESARKRLKSIGVMEEERRGVPATMYFRVDMDLLNQLVDDKLDCRNAPNQNGGKRQTGLHESANPSINRDYTETTDKEHGDTADADRAVPISDPPQKSERQLRAERQYRRRSELYAAYCRGIGITPDGPDAKVGEARAFRELTPVVDLDTPTPADFEECTRFVANQQWRDTVPKVVTVLNEYTGWAARRKQGKQSGSGKRDEPFDFFDGYEEWRPE